MFVPFCPLQLLLFWMGFYQVSHIFLFLFFPSPSLFFLLFSWFRFLPGQGLVLYPQIGDKLDIICPKVDSKTVGQYEYYKVYMVDKDQADSCAIKKDNTPLLNCAKPDQDVKFTIKFQEFSPNLWGLEFQKNKDYYVICKFKISIVHSFKCNCSFICCLVHYKLTKNMNGFVFFSLKIFSCQRIFDIVADFHGASVSLVLGLCQPN